MANKKDLARALAGDKSLRRVDLSGANLDSANLSYADLGGADLTGADLTGAKLKGADLIGADLTGAILSYANLANANLTEANLTGAKLEGAALNDANLAGATLNGADLYEAGLNGANLIGANLSSAKLTRANLSGANLSGANLSGANLSGASLTRTALSGADLTRATLTGANLTGAYLDDAILYRANLSGADLTDADLSGANLTSANLDDATLDGANLGGAIGYVPAVVELERERRRTSGRATGTALKLAAPGVPVDPREFKRRFPKEFDLLSRRGLADRPFRPEAIAAIQKQLASPVEWVVTQKKYKSRAQRYCATPNKVLLLNIDLTGSALTERQQAALRKLAEVSRRSGHPHEKGDLFTVGWVRYCVGPGAWLIEEVQSDVQVARTGLKDPATRTKLADAGIEPESFEEAIAALAPYTEAFFHDAVGLVFELAHQAGVEVEMWEYKFKVQNGADRGFWPLECDDDEEEEGKKLPCHPPKEVYSDLPREMGMQLRAGSRTLPDANVTQVWAYRPNPARSRSRRRRPSR